MYLLKNQAAYQLYFILLLISLASCKHPFSSGINVTLENKQRGVHLFRFNEKTDFHSIKNKHIEWITLVPWSFQKDIDSPRVNHHNGDSLRILEQNSYWVNQIKMVQSAGFKVFLKPHLWLDKPTEGKWRSDVFPRNDSDWESWKNSYEDFILRYAEIAQQTQVDLFCIGTEFSRLSTEKPDFWSELIPKIRKVYVGKITYAANWYKEYESIDFWEQLDFIGIQAYFPLVEQDSPTLNEIENGWLQYTPTLEKLSKKHKRPILFTELGYKSTTNSAAKPWEWLDYPNISHLYSPDIQGNCYQAFFNTIWKKEWFAGVHLWQWRGNLKKLDEYDMLDFTPQGKSAEKIIEKGFK